jgi:hypothetical protein
MNSGFASQQTMIRDGAFKVRTDLLNNKVGKQIVGWLLQTLQQISLKN